MSQQRNFFSGTPQLELMLNLPSTPPPHQLRAESPEPDTQSSTTNSSSSTELSSEMSIDGSCVSSEAEQECLSSQTAPMVLVGCPRCLMYVMLSDANPKCPKCKSTVLLDFLNEETNKKNGT